MKKIIYWVGGFVILVALGFALRPKALLVETHLVKKGDFEETLTVEGRLRSRQKQTVYAYANGNIDALAVKFGDGVKKGQVVSRLDWDKVTQIKSPMDGVISKVFRDSAGPVVRGEPLFEVSSLSDLEVVVELLTTDAVRLKVKGGARILNWGGEAELPAEISHISRVGVTKPSALGVDEERTEVRLNLKDIPAERVQRLGDNFHVEVRFLISQDQGVLTVPLGALFKSGDQWAVFAVSDGRAKLRTVTYTKKSERLALIQTGLSEGDTIVMFPGDKIRDGVKVKAKN